MKKFFPAWIRVLLVFFGSFAGIEYFVDSGDKPAFLVYPIVNFVLLVVLVVTIALEATWEAVDSLMYQLLSEDEKRALQDAKNAPAKENAFYRKAMKWLTRAEPLENEKQLLLNHDYDGIKELDNTLPPWWVYLFYATIFFGAVYLVRFEIADGPDQESELRTELSQAAAAVAEWKKTAPDQMNEEKVTLLTQAADLAKGKTIFETNCIACHRADAGGQIGPNLTDKYWILGGGIKNVFHTITSGGRDGKGMIAWNATLKPTEIQYVASYILSLQGSKPVEPKAPDGEIWVDKTTTPADSTSTSQSKPMALLKQPGDGGK